MANYLKITIICVIILAGFNKTSFGQTNIIFENTLTTIPDGIVADENGFMQPVAISHRTASHSQYSAPLTGFGSLTYKWGKVEYYNKDSENDQWKFNYATYRNFNDIGLLIKTWNEGQHWAKDNNYDVYYYDDRNRTIKIEHYWDSNGLSIQAYHTIEYLNDFPDVEACVIYYTKEVEWDNNKNDWKHVWKIYSGEKRDYTLSKKIANHYEKKVNYTYNTETNQWDVSGYKYDYVVNVKGLITETLVYKATNETEDKWPLILHVKNLINDNGVVFRSERFNYQVSTPYIERWSNIEWDKHDGSMPISGYAVQGANRIKNAKIDYLLINDPNIEYAPRRNFSSVYQNNNSFHYIITDNTGNKLIDNSYFWCDDYSLQELWQGDDYQMQYYDFDDHNWVIYDHNVRKHFYEGDNVITQRDWHRYTYNEYYLDSNELTLSEHYEYDALTDSEPYGRDRSVYSDYRGYSASLNSVLSDEGDLHPTYYNLQGVVIKTPQPGQLLIRKIGHKVDKIIYK